jgi:hypothetical protein
VNFLPIAPAKMEAVRTRLNRWRVKEMSSKDAIKRKVEELQKQAEEIEELGIELLEEAPFDANSQGGWLKALDYSSPLKLIQREAIT